VVDLDRVRVFCSFERESSLNILIFLMGISIFFFFWEGEKNTERLSIEKKKSVAAHGIERVEIRGVGLLRHVPW